MRGLLKIVGIGLVAFIAVAMAQEWRFFATTWFGAVAPEPQLAEEDRQAASESVYLMLTLMRHLYVSGGDRRFADRMPASDGVLDELLADIEYLKKNHRTQDPELKSLEVTGVDVLDPDRVEVRTRELWQVRFPWLGRPGEYDEPRIEVAHWRYLVVRGQGDWQVEGWLRVEGEAEPAAVDVPEVVRP